MLIVILITLIVIAVILGRTNQYLRVIAQNQIGIGNRIADNTTRVVRELKRQ